MAADVGRLRVLAWPLIAAPLLAALAACPGDPASEGLVGWPELDAMRAAWARGDAEDTVVAAPDTISVATDAASEAPTPIGYDASMDGFASSGDPCHDLVTLACDLLGEHSDACVEVRAKAPSGDHPETHEGCVALVDRFLTIEIPSRHSPCRRLARAICRSGEDAERCKEASDEVAVLRRSRQKRACLGELLLFEARELRR